MKTRKLVLIIADVVLLAALIIQLAVKAGDRVKTFDLKDKIDEISISTPDESFTLLLENGSWFVGDKKYPANDNYVSSLTESLSSIKVLDKVATGNNEVVLSRYELSDDKNITVIAKKQGKVLRTLNIGKTSTASSQNYLMIDDGKDIYLASGGLSGVFGKSLSYFRSRNVYSVDKTHISSVSVTKPGEETWTVSKVGAGENMSWVINVPDVLVDSQKASEWFNGLGTIVTPVWHDEGELSGNKLISSEITVDSKIISMDIYEIPAATEEDKPVYYGFCSETPYQFELAYYSVQKFLKNIEDVIQ